MPWALMYKIIPQNVLPVYGIENVEQVLLCQKRKLKNGVFRFTVDCYKEKQEILL